jgi:hypothetical protein
LGDNDTKSMTESAESFNDQRLVFVLRDKDGAEYYVEETVTVGGDKLYLPKTDVVGEGAYMITASAKAQLLALEITVR